MRHDHGKRQAERGRHGGGGGRAGVMSAILTDSVLTARFGVEHKHRSSLSTKQATVAQRARGWTGSRSGTIVIANSKPGSAPTALLSSFHRTACPPHRSSSTRHGGRSIGQHHRGGSPLVRGWIAQFRGGPVPGGPAPIRGKDRGGPARIRAEPVRGGSRRAHSDSPWSRSRRARSSNNFFA